MSEPKLSYEEILQIVKVFESSSEFNEFHLKYGDIEIDLRKHGAAIAAGAGQVDKMQVQPKSEQVIPPAEMPTSVAAPQPKPQAAAAGPAVTPASSVSPVAAAFAPGAYLAKSPMVGTFYSAPEPGAKPFVTVGQRVDAESTVCIIEVMKLMNSVPAGVSGVVSQVLVKDGEPVEFDQVLVVVDPDS